MENGTERQFEVDINHLLDISVNVSVEIGRTRMSIAGLLGLFKGATIELDRVADEPVDIYVNEKLLGKGEIVVANERLGVRITEILSPSERVENLG
jgi:flagellar motor switch protein FliN/FliY